MPFLATMRKVIIALVLAGVALALGLQEDGGIANPDPEFNVDIEGYTLGSVERGSGAMEELRGLHSEPGSLSLEDAVLAEYIGGDGSLKLWVGEAGSSGKAGEMVQKMHSGISGSGVFSPLGNLEIQGVRVYQARGAGSVHYYFAKESRVVWVEGELEREKLGNLVERL